MTALLRRVTIERLDAGGWKLTRERDENGETFTVDDLHDALDCVLAAYRPDGSPRWPQPEPATDTSGTAKAQESTGEKA